MLSCVDRVQIVVTDRAVASRTWQELFAAEQVGEDESRLLGCRRTTLQVGDSLVELLQPMRHSPVQAWAERWGEGLYGVVFGTPDLLQMQRHLDSQAVPFRRDDTTLLLEANELHGMPTSIVEEQPRERVGLLRTIYEVTNPVRDWQDSAAAYTRIFGLDPIRFSHIQSSNYGYEGTLTLFDPPHRLDRIEITQTSGGAAMDRFYHRRGPSLYMCYAECDDLAGLRMRLKELGVRYTDGLDEEEGASLFIHPSSLHGVLMGISRTNYAWTWSGRPELAGPPPASNFPG